MLKRYALTSDAIRRMRLQVKRSEREPQRKPINPETPPRIAEYRLVKFVTDVPPANPTTGVAGEGTGKILRYDDNTKKYEEVDGVARRIINGWPGTTTTATTGKVGSAFFGDGVWQLRGENCS